MSAPNTDFLKYFCLYPLIVIGVLTFLVVCWDGICDFFGGVFDDIADSWKRPPKHHNPFDDYVEVKPRPRHRRKRRWKVFIPFLTYQRRKWIARSDRHRTERKCKDIIAESIATHDDMIDALYEETPSMWAVYRNVRERYRV